MKGTNVIILFVTSVICLAVGFLEVGITGASSFQDITLFSKIFTLLGTAILLFLVVWHIGKMIVDLFTKH